MFSFSVQKEDIVRVVVTGSVDGSVKEMILWSFSIQ